MQISRRPSTSPIQRTKISQRKQVELIGRAGQKKTQDEFDPFESVMTDDPGAFGTDKGGKYYAEQGEIEPNVFEGFEE